MRHISQVYKKLIRSCEDFPECVNINCGGVNDCCSVCREAEDAFLNYLRNRPEPKQKSATIPPSVNVRRD